ncbi:MAG: carboxypeptidase-like regulatory domain-containing protein [Planctomycetes bacterium]|nr:carboxypeptidase-like regulatory domain-containing protein [Planctomycetota bacterium]
MGSPLRAPIAVAALLLAALLVVYWTGRSPVASPVGSPEPEKAAESTPSGFVAPPSSAPARETTAPVRVAAGEEAPVPAFAKGWTARVRGRAVLDGGGRLPADTFVSLLTGANEIDHAETVALLGGLAGVNDLLTRGKLTASLEEVGGWKRSMRARVDGDGAFEIAVPPDLPRFQFDVESDFAAYPGRASWFTLASVEKGALLDLVPGGKVEGTLLGPEGLSFEGSQVTLARSADGRPAVGGRCDAAGRVEIRGVPPDSYAAVVAVPGVGLRRREGIEVLAGEIARFEFRVDAEPWIRGVVVDAAGKGIDDAGIRILLERPDGTHDAGKARSTRTGPDGTFLAGALEPGRYSVFVDPAEGRLGTALPGVEVGPGANAEMVRIVLPSGRFLAGRVIDASGRPVAGAILEVRPDHSAPIRPGGFIRATGESGSDGTFRLEGLGEGILAVEASRSGLSGVVVRGVEGDRDDLVVTLPPPTGIAGRILEEGGTAPVRRFTLNTSLTWREGSASGLRTGPGRPFEEPDGAFEILGMREGTYEVSIKADGFVPETILPVNVKAGEVRRDFEIRMRRGVRARGLVWDRASNRPVEGASVSAEGPAPPGNPQGMFGTRPATSLADGSFEFDGLRAGTLTFRASKPGFPEAKSEPVEVVDGQTLEGIVVRFPFGGVLEGVAAGAEGGPLHPAFALAEGMTPSRTSAGGATDPAGAFRLENLAPGEYTVTVTPFPLSGESRESAVARRLRATARVEEGKTTRVEFPPPPPGCRVSGRVLLAGKGVRNIGVSLRQGPGETLQGVTREDGSYEVHRVRPGPARLEVAWESSGTRTTLPSSIEIPDAPELVHDIALPTGGIDGRVTRASDGKGVPGARVWAAAEEATSGNRFSSPSLTAETDLEGRFSISYVPTGTYSITVQPSTRGAGPRGAHAKREKVRVEEGARTTADFALAEGATLVVSVVDPTGAPISGAGVRFAGEFWIQDSTDESGVARLAGIPPGAAAVLVSHPEHAWGLGETRIEREGETAEVRVTLGQGTEVRVRVLDERGEPFERPAASFAWPGPPGRYAVASVPSGAESKEDRGIARIRLPAGPYEVRAWRSGYLERVLPVEVGEHSPQVIEIRLEPEAPR